MITEYIEAMQTEINPSKSYRITTTKILDMLSRFHNHKTFTKMTREDIITYLNSAQGRSKRSIKQVDRNL